MCSPALEEDRRRRAAREDACPWSGHGGTVATLAPRYVGWQLGQMAVSTHREAGGGHGRPEVTGGRLQGSGDGGVGKDAASFSCWEKLNQRHVMTSRR